MSGQQFEQQVTVGTYTMPYEADIVWSLLEAFEVPVFPADYDTIYIDWLYSNALGGVKLRVNENDAAEAREVIAAALADGEELQLTHSEGACPRCGNSHTFPMVRGRQWAVITAYYRNTARLAMDKVAMLVMPAFLAIGTVR